MRRRTGHKSIAEVARLSGGYPQLIRCLCRHYKIPLVRDGRWGWIANGDVIDVIWHVHAHLKRPRLSRPDPPVLEVPAGILAMIAEGVGT